MVDNTNNSTRIIGRRNMTIGKQKKNGVIMKVKKGSFRYYSCLLYTSDAADE